MSTREMKDSGIEWIGLIPKDWKCKRIKYAGSFVKGKLPGNINDERIGTPIIGASEMLGKPFRVFTTDNEIPKLNKEDIAILWDGANAGITASKLEGIVSSTVVKYHCLDKAFVNTFVSYIFKFAEEYFKEKVCGTTIPHMNMAYINDIPLLQPSIDEQHGIATFLDEKCKDIDTLITLQEEMIAELQAYKQSVISEAVTKGLNPNVTMKDSGVEWIGEIPKHWEICKIKNVIKGIQDGTHGTFNRTKSKYLLLSAKNIKDYGLYISDNESSISKEDYQSIVANGYPRKGDVALCCIGASIGRCCLYNEEIIYAFQRSVSFLRVNRRMMNSFLLYLLKSQICTYQYDTFSNASAQSGIYLGALAKFKITIPPLPEQQAIADYLDTKCSQIDELIALKQQKITELQDYKKSLIYEYVTGKKEVPDNN